MEQVVLKIDGMMCGMCEAHVNDAIRKAVPHAKKVSSSHKKGEASFLTEQPVDLEQVKAAIAQTGYTCLSAQSKPYQKRGLFCF